MIRFGGMAARKWAAMLPLLICMKSNRTENRSKTCSNWDFKVQAPKHFMKLPCHHQQLGRL